MFGACVFQVFQAIRFFVEELAPQQQQEYKSGLVLLDLNLPRRNGLEVLSEMRNSEDLRSLAVVVFTSSSLAVDKRKSLALGAQEYITKPASFDGFVTAVKNACSHLTNGHHPVH